MGVRYYDEAIGLKLQNWIRDPNIRILKPEESTRFFEMTLDNTKDKDIRLPLISLSRDKSIEILNFEKQSKTFAGFKQEMNEKYTIPINVIPIQIGYQLDIYTKGMEEADEYLRNFVFNFVNYPKVVINIPYFDFNIKHESIIHLESAITDNSDIREHLFADQFVRFTLKFNIDDAYLFSMPDKLTATYADSGHFLNIMEKETGEIHPEPITLWNKQL